MKEVNLIEQKDLREKAIGRVEVLDIVGELLLLGDTEFATMNQIANYYKVDIEVIKKVYQNNTEEINSDGIRVMTGKETKEFLVRESISLTNFRGYFEANNQKFANKKNILFPKRAILRIGMLLRDSEIAKEGRTRLLDIFQDTEKQAPQVIENIVSEISEEKQLMLDRVESEILGDYDKVSVINAKLFALKNKRIAELEKENEIITTNALTIIDSRKVINRLVRVIATKEYNGIFGKAFGDFYSKLNYKLSINIKSRDKKKNESYLHTLNEEETYEAEKIARNWANKLGLDVQELLELN